MLAIAEDLVHLDLAEPGAGRTDRGAAPQDDRGRSSRGVGQRPFSATPPAPTQPREPDSWPGLIDDVRAPTDQQLTRNCGQPASDKLDKVP